MRLTTAKRSKFPLLIKYTFLSRPMTISFAWCIIFYEYMIRMEREKSERFNRFIDILQERKLVVLMKLFTHLFAGSIGLEGHASALLSYSTTVWGFFIFIVIVASRPASTQFLLFCKQFLARPICAFLLYEVNEWWRLNSKWIRVIHERIGQPLRSTCTRDLIAFCIYIPA